MIYLFRRRHGSDTASVGHPDRTRRLAHRLLRVRRVGCRLVRRVDALGGRHALIAPHHQRCRTPLHYLLLERLHQKGADHQIESPLIAFDFLVPSL